MIISFDINARVSKQSTFRVLLAVVDVDVLRQAWDPLLWSVVVINHFLSNLKLFESLLDEV